MKHTIGIILYLCFHETAKLFKVSWHSPPIFSILLLCPHPPLPSILLPQSAFSHILFPFSQLVLLHGYSCQFTSPCLVLSYSLKCDQVSFVLAAEARRGVGRGGGPPSFTSYKLCVWVQLLPELLALEIQLFWNCLELIFSVLLRSQCSCQLPVAVISCVSMFFWLILRNRFYSLNAQIACWQWPP